jgi:2,3-bisphosphoglycerate-dependent phosphoglycerate mutase
MYELVLIRHGQSLWNKQNLFTGWEDVELSELGIDEAVSAGQILKKNHSDFDYSYCSMLKRSIKTLWLCLENLDLMNLPNEKSWRLNERHYGDLQGKNKDQARAKFGEEQVKIWRRSYSTKPPQSDPREVPRFYDGLESYPRGESLEDTYNRVVPFWKNDISTRFLQKKAKKILIVAHGNSLRALIKHLENISEEQIVELEIPTGRPISIKLNENLGFIERNYIN